jgi:hypothetical protein
MNRFHVSKREKTKTKRGGRRKLYTNRILLPLAPGVLERIDLMLENGETRLDFIRAMIERGLALRELETKRGRK